MPELNWKSSGNRILLDLLVFKPGSPSDLTNIEARALLDTGATVSGIGPRVVRELGLQSHTKKRLKSATEERFVDYFLFRIGWLMNAEVESNAQPTSLPFIFDELDGFGWGLAGDFDVILGMDVLRQCDFELRRDGLCQLTFG